MTQGMRGRPKTVQYNTVRTRPLGLDPQIIKDLGETLIADEWTMHPESTTLIFRKEGRRVLYIRRFNTLQIYWAGYGQVALEKMLDDFECEADILEWIKFLEDMELPVAEPEDEIDEDEDEISEDELDHMSSYDIINSIFL